MRHSAGLANKALLFGSVLCCFVLMTAQQPAASTRKWAVVIGIGNYANPEISRLKYAEADARATQRFLVDEAGFPPDHVVLMVNEQATLREMKRVLGEFLPARVDRQDLVFIFFAGHGAPEISAAEPDGYTKYLVPYDADPKSLFSSALRMEDLQIIFSRLRSNTLIFAADSCYSGASGGRTFGRTGGTRTIQITDEFLKDLSRGEGRIVVTASEPNELRRR